MVYIYKDTHKGKSTGTGLRRSAGLWRSAQQRNWRLQISTGPQLQKFAALQAVETTFSSSTGAVDIAAATIFAKTNHVGLVSRRRFSGNTSQMDRHYVGTYPLAGLLKCCRGLSLGSLLKRTVRLVDHDSVCNLHYTLLRTCVVNINTSQARNGQHDTFGTPEIQPQQIARSDTGSQQGRMRQTHVETNHTAKGDTSKSQTSGKQSERTQRTIDQKSNPRT